MPAAGFLKSVALRWLAKPIHERQIYKLIRRHRVHNIVEIGVGAAVRSQRIIELAMRYHEGEVRYAGIDMFEARDTNDGLPLKQAYKQLRATGAKVQLIPGDPFAALARAANGLTGTGLLIVSADQDEASLERAWFYVPRMLADDARVLVERPGETPARTTFETLSRDEVNSLAGGQSAPKTRRVVVAEFAITQPTIS